MSASYEHAALMDGVYRRQRHFYDLTRKYYLLGRDPMLVGLNAPAESTILEIGCGTGRNLIKAAGLYPNSRFFGIDISNAMLETAGRNIADSGLKGHVRLAHADAAEFRPAHTFGLRNFDRIFISYAVSMIPQWRSVVEAAAGQLAPGGELHVVDFGDLAGLPDWSRQGLNAWL
jgi:S-adenosylmethionine-diacylgycerolhomoserine-N-methlytransferase